MTDFDPFEMCRILNEEKVNELRAVGNQLANRFESVHESQWSRHGFRSDGSAFTIESIARYLMHDPVHHLWAVGELN